MKIELTADECRVLLELVDERIGELGPEIHHTRTPAYHDELKELRRKLKSLQERLAGAETPSAR